MVKEMSCMDNHQLEHFHYFILEVYFCKVWLMEGSSSLKALNTFGSCQRPVGPHCWCIPTYALIIIQTVKITTHMVIEVARE